MYTVEPLKEDPPIKGQCIVYLSTMDKTKSPNFIPPINIMWLEPLKEDNLYTGENPLEFILVPKCPFLGGYCIPYSTNRRWLCATRMCTFILLSYFIFTSNHGRAICSHAINYTSQVSCSSHAMKNKTKTLCIALLMRLLFKYVVSLKLIVEYYIWMLFSGNKWMFQC